MATVEMRYPDRIEITETDFGGWHFLAWGEKPITKAVGSSGMRSEWTLDPDKSCLKIGNQILSEEYPPQKFAELTDAFRFLNEKENLRQVKLNGETIWDWTD